MNVEATRRPAILAFGDEPLAKLDRRRWDIRLAPCIFAQSDQGVGLLDPGPIDSARPMILEAAPDQGDAVGKKGRRQRITGETGHLAPIEHELDGTAAIDAAAAREPAAHASPSCARPTQRIVWVVVSRSTISHWRHPITCCQNSRCGPRGFSLTKT